MIGKSKLWGYLLITSLFFSPCPALAEIVASSEGSSDGTSLDAVSSETGGTKSVNLSGGSIEESSAKTVVKGAAGKIKISGEIKSTGTSGDAGDTDVTVFSSYSGTATYTGPDVSKYNLDVKINMRLACISPDSGLVFGDAFSKIILTLRAAGITVLSGSATQDASGTFTDTGALDGVFKTKKGKSKLSAKTRVDIGSLTNGQTIDFDAIAELKVKYDAGITINQCTIDFKGAKLRSTAGQKGEITFSLD